MNATLADITLPLWLVVSQWTLLFALGFLVIMVYRQIGFLLRLRDLGTEREGLPTGKKAPVFDYFPVNGDANIPTRFDPTGKWTLLLFIEPSCVSCQSAFLALERLAPKLKSAIYPLVVTSADPALLNAFGIFSTASLPISQVNRDVFLDLYQTRSTPFAYLIDPSGTIQAKGVVGDESSIGKLLQKADHSITKLEFTTV
jgi:thiol-disulfide isomerase/thioredoxin